MLIASSSGTFVKKQLISKEQRKVASKIRLRIVQANVKESVTKLVEYKSKTG